MSALKKGSRFRFGGLSWRVEYVNDSRAHCVAKVVEKVELRLDTPRTFTATRTRVMDISPNTDTSLLAELCP